MIDSFGDSDPRKTPKHLFWNASRLDYDKAVRADISKQNYSVCPRHWYIDAVINCNRCDREFVFSVDEQRYWYEELGFWVDSRATQCRECRKELRELKMLKQEYDRDITAGLTRNAGVEQKERLLLLLMALETGGVELLDAMQEKRRVLTKQIERLRRPNS
ncbi:MAG: zinc-ribbon domain containing protein [Pirellulales bacterium]